MEHNHHGAINGSYYFRRSQSADVVRVFNSDSYVMAEYNMRTGRISWQRVAPVTQRERVEKWLGQHYPVAGLTPKPVKTATKLKARAAKA